MKDTQYPTRKKPYTIREHYQPQDRLRRAWARWMLRKRKKGKQ
jgi:hypothetical protein